MSEKVDKKDDKKHKSEGRPKADGKSGEDKHQKAKGRPRPPEAKQKGEPGVIQLVRVSGVVVDGNLDIARALMKIKGIGNRVANAIVPKLGLDRKTKIGSLSEQQIDDLETSIAGISSSIPAWMLNRRKDRDTGNNMHLTGNDLDYARREDINLEKKIKSYRGMRHSLGLPVRGQRTRSTGRTGGTMGVARKKVVTTTP